jgi:hypothetical protein
MGGKREEKGGREEGEREEGERGVGKFTRMAR